MERNRGKQTKDNGSDNEGRKERVKGKQKENRVQTRKSQRVLEKL